jgi:hypothetical protein
MSQLANIEENFSLRHFINPITDEATSREPGKVVIVMQTRLAGQLDWKPLLRVQRTYLKWSHEVSASWAGWLLLPLASWG